MKIVKIYFSIYLYIKATLNERSHQLRWLVFSRKTCTYTHTHTPFVGKIYHYFFTFILNFHLVLLCTILTKCSFFFLKALDYTLVSLKKIQTMVSLCLLYISSIHRYIFFHFVHAFSYLDLFTQYDSCFSFFFFRHLYFLLGLRMLLKIHNQKM